MEVNEQEWHVVCIILSYLASSYFGKKKKKKSVMSVWRSGAIGLPSALTQILPRPPTVGFRVECKTRLLSDSSDQSKIISARSRTSLRRKIVV